MISKQNGETPLEDYSGLLVTVHSRAQLNALEFENINKAMTKYLLGPLSEKKTPFTYEWFIKIHTEMFGDVWKWAGQIRKTNKSIGIDKLQIQQALKTLEKDYHYWLSSSMKQIELCARLHHRLVWIHPFENGNGRWARLITNIHLKKHRLLLIQWPEKKLLDVSNIRKKYLKALRDADNGNFSSLISLQKSLSK